MTLDEIQAKAEETAQKYNPDSLAPFPFQQLQTDYPSLKLYSVDDLAEDVTGAIGYEASEKKFSIFISSKLSEAKKNFVLAHLLGHFFLHSKYLKENEVLVDQDILLDGCFLFSQQDTQIRMQLEVEANNFAASLLMPEELLLQVWEALHSIQGSAKVFNVPALAMSFRLEQLGLLP